VRSWEDRFAARLLRVGFAEISLLIAWLPRSIEHAQREPHGNTHLDVLVGLTPRSRPAPFALWPPRKRGHDLNSRQLCHSAQPFVCQQPASRARKLHLNETVTLRCCWSAQRAPMTAAEPA